MPNEGLPPTKEDSLESVKIGRVTIRVGDRVKFSTSGVRDAEGVVEDIACVTRTDTGESRVSLRIVGENGEVRTPAADTITKIKVITIQ